MKIRGPAATLEALLSVPSTRAAALRRDSPGPAARRPVRASAGLGGAVDADRFGQPTCVVHRRIIPSGAWTCQGSTLDDARQRALTHPSGQCTMGLCALTDKNQIYHIQHETIEGCAGSSRRRPVEHPRRGDWSWDRAGSPSSARKTACGWAHLARSRASAAILDRLARGTKVRRASLCRRGPEPITSARGGRTRRAIRVGGVGIHQLLAQPFVDLAAFTEDDGFGAEVPEGARGLVRLLHHQARALDSVGLGHLSGDRGMLEVSEGEGRRARLAAVLNASHTGLCLLLDEPARGLHDEDVEGLADALAELATAHTVVMNEHRHAIARAADHLVELGPGAGDAGGEVIYQGPMYKSTWGKAPRIVRAHPPVTRARHARVRGPSTTEVSCDLPLGRLTCLTGVSGSGKSSFVRGILVPAVAGALQPQPRLDDFGLRSGTWESIAGVEHLTGLVALDQKAPPPNRRSTVATFLDVADHIRAAFAATDEARRVGLSVIDFGLNTGEGRCQICLGIGEVEDRDVWTPCPLCGGTRFAQEALSVRVDGESIAALLETPVSALRVRSTRMLSPHLPLFEAMVDLGLGHLSLGRRLDTLSGGEVQRLRIAGKLAARALFVLDEPAAGLHHDGSPARADRILDGGDLSSSWYNADHPGRGLEIGRVGGPHGGRVVAAGTRR
jgi:energy-coupling factor transporter ATP-binding protein EcfA2